MFKFKGALDGHSDKIAVFNLPPTDASVESTEWIEYRPSGQLLPNSPIEFNIFGSSTTYIDLRESLLYVKLKITNGDNVSVTSNNNVGLINLPLKTLWSQVDFTLQQQILTSSVSTNYAYKSILDAILKKDLSNQSSALESEGYFKDSANGIDDADAMQGRNTGLFYRYQLTKDGQIVEFMGGLSLDLMDDTQRRLLINGIQLGIKLWPNKKEFCLLSTDENADYKVHIVDAKLKLKHIKLTPGAFIGHQEAISKSDALYPFYRSDLKTFNIPAGQYSFSADDLYLGAVPSHLIVTLQTSEGFNGSYKKNPFNFQSFDCGYIGFFVNGQSTPSSPLTPNFSSKNYLESYFSLCSNSKVVNVSREDYPKGYCIYVFNLESCDKEDMFPLLRKGHTRIELKFNTPLTETVTLLLYAKFPSCLSIDAARNVNIR